MVSSESLEKRRRHHEQGFRCYLCIDQTPREYLGCIGFVRQDNKQIDHGSSNRENA